MKKNVPKIVVRALIFVYTKQEAWVRWGNVCSKIFNISNGTRQGSILSPAIFSIYIDDLIKDLRKLGLGCRVGGIWMAAVGYADDLLLMAPNRLAMEKMLEICEKYADMHNLKFSTDENPNKSKSKCIYMFNSRSRTISKPAPLQLYGRDLPWVKSATHLGNELFEDGSMEYDCKIKRAKFIDNSLNVREMFEFAKPREILRAVQIYCGDMYGSSLWDLYGSVSAKYFRCWNTAVRLCWDVPRSTHTKYVRGFLSCDLLSLRTQCIARYVNFLKSLFECRSKEVAVLSRIVANNVSTITGRNILNIKLETGISPTKTTSKFLQHILHMQERNVDSKEWDSWLLEKYLDIRNDQRSKGDNTKYIDSLIISICSS